MKKRFTEAQIVGFLREAMPGYLNDIEHDRRDPPSEFFIEQFARVLKLKKDPLIAAAGMWPSDLQQSLPGADPKKVEQAFTAFRQVLNKKEKP